MKDLFFYLFIAIEILHITRFIVKIGLKNLPSINLFTNKLHFQIVNRNIFIYFNHEYQFRFKHQKFFKKLQWNDL
jgi:hypothetical protein